MRGEYSLDKIPVNPKAREAFNQMKNELGSELGINVDKGNLPSRLFSFNGKQAKRIKIKN